jgi:death-on-curing protein
LAAAYAFGLSKNHPFADGNKRVALVVAFAFLELNQIEINAPQEKTYFVFIDLAAGKLEEQDLAKWLEQHARHVEEP